MSRQQQQLKSTITQLNLDAELSWVIIIIISEITLRDNKMDFPDYVISILHSKKNRDINKGANP